MFANPVPASSQVDEGTVVQVDPIRVLCKVKTLSGQVLNSVQWLVPMGGSTRAGDRFSPMIGDRVMLNFGLGYPVIVGFFPRLQTADGATPLSINSGQPSPDMGSYSPEGSITWADQNKPKDMVHGDRVLSSVGGAMLGLLRSGALFLRANRGAEIFMSTLHNLVRIVSRNWEHFTDVSTDVVRNFKGSVYRYVGYAATFAKAKVEDYNLHFYYGNTDTAEKVKTNYNSSALSPISTEVVYKEQITDNSNPPVELMRRTIELNGNEEVWIKSPGGATFTRIKSTGDQLTLAWNDENIATINEQKIHFVHKDGADVILNPQGIRATFKDGLINMEAAKVESTFQSAQVTLDAAKVRAKLSNTTATLTANNAELVCGAGKCTVTPSSTAIINSGHAVTVTAAGIAIT